jgi:hypothetical protein
LKLRPKNGKRLSFAPFEKHTEPQIYHAQDRHRHSATRKISKEIAGAIGLRSDAEEKSVERAVTFARPVR